MSEYRYYIRKIYQPAPDQVVLGVGDKNGRPVFNFRPGQYAMISYRNSRGQIEDKHAFSIASSPSQIELIYFGIKIEGAFTHGLLNLKVGAELRVYGPYGKFYYDENKYSDLVMIAGGIGITPFFSALNYAADLKLNNKLSLIYSARTKNGAPFYNEIRDLEKRNPNMSTLFSFTDEKETSEGKKVLGQRVDAKIIQDFIGDISGKTFFVCGPSLFMAAMIANLLSLGVARNQIAMEEFSMIPDRAFESRLKNISYALAFSILVFIISFNLIHKSTSAAVKKNYDLTSTNKINQAAYEQTIISQPKARAPFSAKTIRQTVNSVVQPVQDPVYTPAPVYIPAPVYTPPAPVTGASSVRY